MLITRHPLVNTRHSYTETPYNPTTIFGVLGVDHFFDPDNPLLQRSAVLRHQVVLVASMLFFSVGAQGSYFNVGE
jgi:hypothetical protein